MRGRVNWTRTWKPIKALSVKRALLVVLAVVAVNSSAIAQTQPETTWDLRTLYRMALSNDPTYLAAARTAEANKQALPLARSALFPQISASATRSKTDETLITNPDLPTETRVTADTDSDSYTLSVDQTVFDAQLFAGLSQAQAIALQAEAELRDAKQDLILRTTQQYFNFLRAQDERSLTKAEHAALKEQAALAKARLEVGMAAITETYEANARLALVEARLIEKQILLDRARDDLRILSNQPVNTVVPIRPGFIIPELKNKDVADWIKQALDHNALLLAKVSATEAAKKEISRQRAGYYPSVNFTGEHNQRLSDDSLQTLNAETDYESTQYRLELTVPLFQGGSTLIQTREARLRYEAEQQQLERLRRELQRDAREAFFNVSSGKRKLAALAQAVKANESVVDAKQTGFRAGINTNQHVLDAQRDLFEAKRDHANARYDTILSWLTLKKLTGSLTDDDLYRIGDVIR